MKYEVRIYKPKDINERFYVYIYLDGKIIKKYYKGINTSFDYDERYLSAQAAKIAIERELKSGWNPAEPKRKNSDLPFNSALDFAMAKKKDAISTKTFLDYSCTIRFVKSAAAKLKIDKLAIIRCERYHIKSIFDEIQSQRKWTGKNYNKHLGYLKSIFTELVEWEVIPTNIIKDIRPQKETKTEGYLQLTETEHKKVFEHLKKVNFNFYIFESITYYLGIRPKELMSLKCSDVKMDLGIISVRSASSKVGKYRYVPILGNVKELLSNFDLSNPDYFLFGKSKDYGCKYYKKDLFCPNEFPLGRNTSTNTWKKLIIDGLGINKKQYGLKHKGANDKMRAGMDLKTISTIFGHSDEKITEIYANFINEVRFNEAKEIKLDEY